MEVTIGGIGRILGPLLLLVACHGGLVTAGCLIVAPAGGQIALRGGLIPGEGRLCVSVGAFLRWDRSAVAAGRVKALAHHRGYALGIGGQRIILQSAGHRFQ
ncbi:hypothetical protein Psi01_85060 [Planobispora siamensis]|uniref:Uncharacterized protein n=1 Tax=Planobispora siamensis TaxID=936338 RepID=A0A8J3WSG2_9ACTN|nr:hypothetical protein Psi01_85060 [Planobispora siamensis]